MTLVEPRLSAQAWQSVAQLPHRLLVKWAELPKNYVEILDAFANRRVTFSFEQELSEPEQNAFKERGHRLVPVPSYSRSWPPSE